MPVWLLVQNSDELPYWEEIGRSVYKGFQAAVRHSDLGQSVALLVESPGGEPDEAFRLARLFQRRVERFVVAVPQYAKSAATLLALGAHELILGREAELGPLDIQLFETRREEFDSALNTVQSLERLSAHALSAVDQTMQLLLRRLPHTSEVLLPFALDYVAKLLRPLLEKVDTVEYSRKSRDLKTAEEYAARLMRSRYGFERGREIARKLIEDYPSHGFVVDRDEAVAHDSLEDDENPDDEFGLGLEVVPAARNLQRLFDEMIPYLDEITAIGRLEEVDNG
jgi:hypothetical protein